MDKFMYFSNAEWNFLIRLLLAHLLSDFVFQARWMVEDKRWNSTGLLAHIAVTIITALVLTGNLTVVFVIGALHYLIDIAKTKLTQRHPEQSFLLFIADQVAHVVVIVLVWMWDLEKAEAFLLTMKDFITDYKIMLVLMAYVFVIWPCAYIVNFSVQGLLQPGTTEENERIQNGGKWIGQFERIIILTIVLANQYAAVGFLLTGKSIIRFATRETFQSEYVIAGTMLSFALAISAGALVNWLM